MAIGRLVKTDIETTGRARVYLAEEDVQLGAMVTAKVQAAIRRSDAVVVLITHQSETSAWVNHEIGYALRDKLVIPLVEIGVDMNRFGMLGGYEYAKFEPTNPREAILALNELVLRKAGQKDMQQLITILLLVGLLVILAYGTEGAS